MRATISERVVRPITVAIAKIQPWTAPGAPASYIQFSCGHAVVRPPDAARQVGSPDTCARHYEWVEVQS